MIVAKPIKNEAEALQLQSEAFGKYGIELINEHRATLNLAAIEWNQELHDLAFNYSKDMISDGKDANLVALPTDQRLKSIQSVLPDVTSFKESVKESNASKPSRAVRDEIDQLLLLNTSDKAAVEDSANNIGALALVSTFTETTTDVNGSQMTSKTFRHVFTQILAVQTVQQP